MKVFMITLITGMMVAGFAWWLNQDRYDVRYTLSEQIPLGFDAAKQEAVQQLEVKNLGRTAALGIQVKIPSSISQFQVIKNSEADEPKTYLRPEGFELVYSSLPPQGSFRLVFKTSGKGIPLKDVQVSHSRGQAEEALSNGNSLAGEIATGAIVLLYVLFLGSIGLDIYYGHLRHKAMFECEAILKSDRPFFVFAGRWKKIRDLATDEFTHKEIRTYGELAASEILTWPIYRWLDSPKPTNFSEEEWLKFCAEKPKQFISIIKRRLSESWMKANEAQSLLKIRKPTHIPSEAWQPLYTEIEDVYVSLRVSEITGFGSNGSYPSVPDEVDPLLWARVTTKASKIRCDKILSDLSYASSPIEALQKKNLTMLSVEQIQKLKSDAYSRQIARFDMPMDEDGAQEFLRNPRPSWIAEDDYHRIKKRAEGIVRGEERSRKNEIVERELFEVLHGESLSKAVEKLDDETMRRLEKIQMTVARLSKEAEKNGEDARKNSSESQKIGQVSKEVSEGRTKVLRQLQIIANLFDDPKTIERIESYDNPFAPGNFELLQLLGKRLADARGPGSGAVS